jgi:hypothetical protein
MWGKPKSEPIGIPAHITRRVSALPTPDLTDWADQAIYTTGRYLTQYQRSREQSDLDEAETGAQVLMAVIAELRKRG